jgi:hypothetical protein
LIKRKIKKKKTGTGNRGHPRRDGRPILETDFIKLNIQLVQKDIMIILTFAVIMEVLVFALYHLIDNTI